MDNILLAVNGTLMRGLELNQNLLDAPAEFVHETRTSPKYRIWSIDDRYPAMQRYDHGGAQIELEIWEIPLEGLIDVFNSEPPGLCLGKIELNNGQWVLGVLGERFICVDRLEITQWGGWRKYISKK